MPGVVTLMLNANERMGWRDVQNILAQSAPMPIGFGVAARTLEYTSASGPGIARMNEDVFKVTGLTNTNWNGGGLHHSNDYGYGAVNADAAVQMAEIWNLLDSAQTSATDVHGATPTDGSGPPAQYPSSRNPASITPASASIRPRI